MAENPTISDEAEVERQQQDLTAGGPADAGRSGPEPRYGTGDRIRLFLYRYAVLLALVAFLAGFSILLPQTYFTRGNFTTMLSSQAVLLILALGLTLPLATGEFDLSIGSMLGFSAILLAYLSGTSHWGLAPAVVAVLLAGLVVGLVNGLFVVGFGVNAFIATLGTSTVLTGLTLAVSNGQILNGVPASLMDFTSATPFGLATPVYIAFGLAIVLWYVYDHTPLGRYFFFVGEGRQVARLVGLHVDRLRWGAFVASAVISSMSGILAVGQLGAADPSVGPSYLLPAYAAAFLGATTIKPGRFNAWGTVIALYLLVAGVTGIELEGASSWAEQVFDGGALVIAVTFAHLVSRERSLI